MSAGRSTFPKDALCAERGIITSWLVKVVLTVAVAGFVLLEVGAVVFNILQTRDVADQAAAEAGITYLANNGSLQSAEERAREFVEDSGVKLLELRTDPAARTITVVVEKRASTRVVHRIDALKDMTVVKATGSAPLRK